MIVSTLTSLEKEEKHKNDDEDHDNNNNDEEEDIMSQQVLAHGGVNFEQFCLVGDALRDNMHAASTFGVDTTEHDKCLLLQHKIMETISAKKLLERAKYQRISMKKMNNSNKNNNTQSKVHKLQWFEIAFLKEAHTENLLKRPDSDKLTSSYRQAPLFKSSNNHNSLVLVPSTTPTPNEKENNDGNNNNNNTSYIQVSSYRPPTQERRLPRSHAHTTIAPWYDGRKVATMPTSSNVRHVYSTRGRRDLLRRGWKKSKLETMERKMMFC